MKNLVLVLSALFAMTAFADDHGTAAPAAAHEEKAPAHHDAKKDMKKKKKAAKAEKHAEEAPKADAPASH